MSVTNDGTRFYASNPAGDACSNELLGARLPQAPPASTIPERRLCQKLLDTKAMMREKRST